MNLQAAASQHRPAWSSSASCQLPAIRRCAARCWPTLSKLLTRLISAVRSMHALASYADSRFYCTLDSGASGANERKRACFHGLLSVSARRGRQRVRDPHFHRRHENNRHSHFPRIQNPRLPSCSLERCAGSSDTGSVKNAQPQSRERSTLVRRRRMVQSPRYMSTDSTFRSRAGQRRVVSPRIQRQRTNHGFLRMTVP